MFCSTEMSRKKKKTMNGEGELCLRELRDEREEDAMGDEPFRRVVGWFMLFEV